MNEPTTVTQGWSSRLVFILATIGFSVGLGNIWKFPYVAGENGGGAFVLVYLGCAFLIGLPLVIAEMLLGRRGRGTPVTAMRNLIARHGHHRGWAVIGWMALATVFLIMSFYSVIAGWTIDYTLLALGGKFNGITTEGSASLFDSVLASPARLILFETIFLAVTLWIVERGLSDGIERAVSLLMPALFVLLIVLTVYSLLVGDAVAGLAFLFNPDFSKINGGVILAAVGQAFFSIGVGMAAMLTYGAYLSREENIPSASVIVVIADTSVAILAGIVIFPLVFGFGLEPGQGPGLIFQTLPVAFGQMPMGAPFGALFFVLLFVAALTSSIAIVEPVVSYAAERGVSRRKTVVVYGLTLWVSGWLAALSFNVLADFHPLSFLSRFSGSTLFDLMDFLSSNLLLTIGGLLIGLFVGWMLPAADTADELNLQPAQIQYRAWRFLVRWICPPAIFVVVVFGLVA